MGKKTQDTLVKEKNSRRTVHFARFFIDVLMRKKKEKRFGLDSDILRCAGTLPLCRGRDIFLPWQGYGIEIDI